MTSVINPFYKFLKVYYLAKLFNFRKLHDHLKLVSELKNNEINF